jgi:hypothetical protein
MPLEPANEPVDRSLASRPGPREGWPPVALCLLTVHSGCPPRGSLSTLRVRGPRA